MAKFYWPQKRLKCQNWFTPIVVVVVFLLFVTVCVHWGDASLIESRFLQLPNCKLLDLVPKINATGFLHYAAARLHWIRNWIWIFGSYKSRSQSFSQHHIQFHCSSAIIRNCFNILISDNFSKNMVRHLTIVIFAIKIQLNNN